MEDGGLFLDTPISGSISQGYIYMRQTVRIYILHMTKKQRAYMEPEKNSILYMTEKRADDLTAKSAKASITVYQTGLPETCDYMEKGKECRRI